jgi:peptidoglycan hydrolase CwlO-like protein
MLGYKSTPERLSRLFEQSRNAWKERATQRHKRIRALDVKVRDLSLSRDHWKDRAKEAEDKLHQLQKELEALQKRGVPTTTTPPPEH